MSQDKVLREWHTVIALISCFFYSERVALAETLLRGITESWTSATITCDSTTTAPADVEEKIFFNRWSFQCTCCLSLQTYCWLIKPNPCITLILYVFVFYVYCIFLFVFCMYLCVHLLEEFFTLMIKKAACR